MNRRVKRRAAALLLLAALPLLYLNCANAQLQAARPRRATATGATTITVKAGEDLQRALNSARPGDEVILEAGAVFAGNFVLPVKSGDSFITVRSSRAGELAEGRRVTPSDAPRMARVATPNSGPALLAPPNSHHWRLVGLEVTQSGSFDTYDLIQLGDGDARGPQDAAAKAPHDINIDRCYLHAFDDATTLKRGVSLNSANTSLLNSHVSGVKARGQEAQAVAGWNGPGPFTIENNYLEGAGINLLFGGAAAAIPNLVPSDITIRGNHFYKPTAWKGVWMVKNLLELKNARRVTVTGNIFENCWPDSQTGWAVIFNAFADGPSNAVEDVEFTLNVVRNASNGINLRGMEATDRATRMRRIRVTNNLFTEVGAYGGEGKVFQLLNGTESVQIDHNTVAGRVSTVLMLDAVGGFRHEGFAFTNNLAPHGDYGIFGNGGTLGIAALEQFCRRWSFAGNVIAGADANRYPSGNLYPTTFGPDLFADAARGDYRIRHTRFKGRATDGKDPGCDFERLGAATAWYTRPGGV
jgi:parallel beta helix pectate lyase-like protein